MSAAERFRARGKRVTVRSRGNVEQSGAANEGGLGASILRLNAGELGESPLDFANG